MFNRKQLALSIISGFLFCGAINAAAPSSSSSDAAQMDPFEFFKKYLNYKDDESSILDESLSKNPTETEAFIREYKNRYTPEGWNKIANGGIEASPSVLHKIFLLTKLGDHGESFLKDAFKFRNLDWNSFEKSGTIEKFIKDNSRDLSSYYLIEQFIKGLYSKGLIPQDKLDLLVFIIGEYIIRRIGFVTTSGFEVLFKEIIEAILSSYPNGKTAPLDGLSKESGQGLSLNAQSDQRIELNKALNDKITGFLTRDYSLIEKIAGYLQKAINSNRIGEQILALWKKIVEQEKAKLDESKKK